MTGLGVRNLRSAVTAVCAALAMTCSAVGAVEVPLVDGVLWTKSTEEIKRAYLVGLNNVIQVETAYHADNPSPDESSFAPRVARGMKGQTLTSVLEALDKWYAAHPDQLRRPVIETIWFEMVLPALPKTK
ncbi:conserved exported hypothetical protein [Candidatus Accumulibacter aalborgensis]|uniref:Uncharacterized protein n=1 Tax=Candidatus Accumulibacter aalborgensis TaxID=1860102 RepID=A0A1A8XUT3_9PROT|nr:hypothetical protein [Candidatus Accumulibacter aalborgensis]SBT07708.1 conserved exported hypothetical protein [Candidatus Accumulibacter aalborgensis]